MKYGARIGLIVALVIISRIVLAYEVDTHEKISEPAAKSSVLKADNEVLRRLGLQFPIEDDRQQFPNSKGEPRNILNLIKEGSKFEDSLIFIRPIHHFYDPISGGALLPILAKPSPDWALEDKGQISFLLFQRYSFADGRDYFYRALTATNPDDHDLYFGKTFETLGHVIHHIQDMAQPQHVRLDPHLKLSDADKPDWFFEDGSRYEFYTKGLGGNLPFNTYAPVNAATDINFLTTARSFWHTAQGGGMGLAEFSNTNFVSAGTNFRGAFQDDGLIARPNERYPLPAPSPTTPTFELANNLLGQDTPPECVPPNNPCVMAFFSTEVTDNYRPQPGLVNPKASTASIFDQDLQFYGKTVSYPNLDKCTDPNNPNTCEKVETSQVFSLNSFNFDEAHKFLIPRAVAYSAGLIDYFFRGKLEAEDVTFTDNGISLRVKNAIDPQKTPAWQNEVLYAKNSNGSAGSLTVAFDYQDSAGKTQYGVSNTVPMRATDTLAPGQVSADVYDFTLTVPPEAKDVNYRLVFRGKLGQEENSVAVGAIEPISGFVVTPNYLPADGISGPRAIFKQGGQWRLSDKQGLLAGNIDWKGWYVNGKPTKVLSWGGPELRYFHDARYENFRREIFENGEIFDSAPAPVLGAAITKDHAGVEWVVAIVKEEFEDVAYRRLHAKNDSPDPREQWQEVGRFNAAANDGTNEMTDEARTPWFFSGDGKEAQHMRIWGRDTDVPRMTRFKRLKMMLNTTVDSAEFSDRGNLPGFQLSESCSGGYDSEGRGTITVTGRSEGEYTIAVDYMNDTELHAKIRLDSSSSAVYVDSGSSIVHQYSWKEYIDWGAGEILYFDSSRKAEGSTSVQNQEAFFRWRQHLYGFDLRHDLYAYTYYQDKKNARVESMGPFVPPMRFGIAELIEGGQIDRQGYPSVIIYGPVTSESTDPDLSLIQSPTQCGSDYSTTRYGTLTFGTYSRLGGAYAAVDTNDNLVASFGYIDFDNRAHVFSHLSEGVLAELIPGAPPIPEYAPIGVLR